MLEHRGVDLQKKVCFIIIVEHRRVLLGTWGAITNLKEKMHYCIVCCGCCLFCGKRVLIRTYANTCIVQS